MCYILYFTNNNLFCSPGSDNESSLDNFFTSSRSAQQRFHSEAGSDPESEANTAKKNTTNEVIVDEKPKKCEFKNFKKNEYTKKEE
jgi:hypothetical protein